MCGPFVSVVGLDNDKLNAHTGLSGVWNCLYSNVSKFVFNKLWGESQRLKNKCFVLKWVASETDTLLSRDRSYKTIHFIGLMTNKYIIHIRYSWFYLKKFWLGWSRSNVLLSCMTDISNRFYVLLCQTTFKIFSRHKPTLKCIQEFYCIKLTRNIS